MIGGEASTRILNEVLMGETPAKPDTPEEAAHRAALTREVAEIRAQGGSAEPDKEWS